MQKCILLSSAILGGLGVMIGAFGAHALKDMLEASGRLETFETAVKYQFYHVLAMLAIGLLMYKIEDTKLAYAGVSMLTGTIIFSGSLYILCATGVTKWGAVTPIGGVFMIIGWILLAIVFASLK